MRLVFGQDQAVAEWVARRIPHADEFRDFSAIGVADKTRPIAGFVFTEYVEKYGTMQLSAAASTPRWAQKGIIRAILNYPFEQVGIQKLWTATPLSNARAIKFNLGVGFVKEGVLGRHFGDQHAVICRMYREDYLKRYKEQGLGKEDTQRAAAG